MSLSAASTLVLNNFVTSISPSQSQSNFVADKIHVGMSKTPKNIHQLLVAKHNFHNNGLL